jgi:hypothetical protein
VIGVIAVMLAAGTAAFGITVAMLEGDEEPTPTTQSRPHEVPEGVTVVAADQSPRFDILPNFAGNGSTVAMWTGTSFGIEEKSRTEVLVSTDGGVTLRTAPFHRPLNGLTVAVGTKDLTVIGSLCRDPGDGDSCIERSRRPEAWRISLPDLSVSRLPEPPIGRFAAIGGSGMLGGATWFSIDREAGPALLVYDDGWSVRPLPKRTNGICATGERLTLVAPSQHDFDDAKPVLRGGTAWSAYTSDDLGRHWSKPIPYPSARDHDYTSTIHVSCGPRSILVGFFQLAAFDPRDATWSALVPPAAERSAMTDMAWTGPDEAVAWSYEDGRDVARTFTGIGSADVRAVAGPALPANYVTVQDVGWPNGSSVPAYVMLRDGPGDLLSLATVG